MENLHDWTLVSVHLDWCSAQATLVFHDTQDRARILTAVQVDLLEVPVARPWGPSSSVNVASMNAAAGAQSVLLQIEMQSGDLIQVRAGEIQLA